MANFFSYKTISRESIPDALEKAGRYRLLGEPEEAESVCLDILQADPGNQEALISLILAVSDQFRKERRPRVELAQQLVAKLDDEYSRRYYTAVVKERDALAYLDSGNVPALACMRFIETMEAYALAEEIRPPGDDSPILRWNACLRVIRRRQLKPGLEKESYITPDGQQA
jgi:hypothetical protein